MLSSNKDIYFYFYKVRYFEGANEHTSDGITCGSSWNEVISNLVEYYGEDEMVEIIRLVILGMGGPCLSAEAFQNSLKEANIEYSFSKEDPFEMNIS